MATMEELRAKVAPWVGQMVRLNGGSPTMLHQLHQADSDEEYGGWVTGDWLMSCAGPEAKDSPGSWAINNLAYFSEHNCTVELA